MKLTEETKFPVAVMLILTLLLTVTLLFVPFPVRGAAVPTSQPLLSFLVHPVDASAKTHQEGSPASAPAPKGPSYLPDPVGPAISAEEAEKTAHHEGDKEKIIYLTFDDGPSRNTSRLLDILKQNNVKATFFVTNAQPGYEDMIKRAHEEGHTIGVHTYTHTYSKVYASREAYWNDFTKMDAIIYEQIGEHAKLVRFPGGTSNTVHIRYCPGVMEQIVNDCNQLGIEYVDWNTYDGDAGEVKSTGAITNFAIRQISRNREPRQVVLLHDTHENTVSAVARIIRWGKANGYEFRAYQPGEYVTHMKISQKAIDTARVPSTTVPATAPAGSR